MTVRIGRDVTLPSATARNRIGDSRQVVDPRCDWQECERVASQHGKSFYMASRLLPSHRRRAILAAYAYCRIADDIVDRGRLDERAVTEARLANWKLELDYPTHPVSRAFSGVCHEFNIPFEPIRDLFAGLRMDIEHSMLRDWSELRRYCYHVAGTVGLIVAPILGCNDKTALTHAIDLGIAMQLTNILRDVAEDASMGRLYLPVDELAAFDIEPADIFAHDPGPRFPELMQFQIARARDLYSNAESGIPSLAPSGQFAALLASQLYAGILESIESLEYDVFSTRAHVPATRKLTRALITGTTLMGAWIREIGSPGGSMR